VHWFNFFIFVIAIILIGGIFFVTQKDSFFGNFGLKHPTSIFPTGADQLRVISPTIQQQQTLGQETQVLKSQQVQPTFGVEEGMKASYSAVIKTTKGDIKLTLKGSVAPRTVKNFIDKAKSGYYNGLTFHRVEDWVIQGGDPKGDSTGGELMQTELNNEPFVAGVLGMARGADIRISNDSQFFITKTDANWLTGQYTNFGIVTERMDVVNKIEIGDKILRIVIE
jgi:peptidyl-prolyl cis-trans isomerase B (cyclophilin B)